MARGRGGSHKGMLASRLEYPLYYFEYRGESGSRILCARVLIPRPG